MPEDNLAPPNSDPIILTHSPEPEEGTSANLSGNSHGLDLSGLDSDSSAEGDGEGEWELYDGAEYQHVNAGMFRRNDDLHPIVQGLSISDAEACSALENAAFPEHERASLEKIQYRLTVSPSVCLGLLSSTRLQPEASSAPAWAASRPPDSSTPKHKYLLLGHVIATLTTADNVTDASMACPANFRQHENYQPAAATTSETTGSTSANVAALPEANQSPDTLGHHPAGRTIAIHSVCVLPQFQGHGLGKILLRSYLQRMEGSGIADKAVLLARKEMAGWYANQFGFEDAGESEATFGGGGWRNMVYIFNDLAHWG